MTLLDHLIDTRYVPHTSAADLRAQCYVLDPGIWYPRAVWDQLKRYERQWLLVYSAALTSRGATIVGRSAARMHGMWVVALTDEKVELSLRSRSYSPARQASGRYQFRYSRLRDDETVTPATCHPCPVTTPIRTFFDIARYHGFAEGLIAADWLLASGVHRGEIDRALEGLGRLKGIAVVRACLKHATHQSQSPFESLARALLILAGIDDIQVQVRIRGYYADIVIDGWLIIEIDGAVKYQGPNAEAVRQAEFNRQKDIANQGYEFLRYAPEFLLKHPERFVAEVEARRAARAGRAGR